MKICAFSLGPIVALMLPLLAGCKGSSRMDLVAAHVVKVQRTDAEGYELLPPEVTRQEGVVTFRGEVRRRPSYFGPTDEHVHIDLLDAKNEWIDQIAIHWKPQQIPTTGNRSAVYEVNYFWSPPPGALVRVSIADDSHDSTIPSGGSSAAGGPSAPGQPKGIYTPSPGGTPRSSATRTPGTPRQPSQPHTPGVPRGSGGRR